MKMLPFVKWYLLNDYWPDKPSERRSLVLNKGLYFTLFLIGFVSLGFYGGLKGTIQKELDDPYANSIPASSNMMDELDTTLLRSGNPDLQFDRITNINASSGVSYEEGIAVDTLSVDGRAVSMNHPYMSIVMREIVWENRNLEHGRGIYLSEDAAINMGLNLDFDSLSMTLVDLGIHSLGKAMPVKGVCRNLPMDIDLLIPLNLHDQVLKEKYAEERLKQMLGKPSRMWEMTVSSIFIPFDKLYTWSDLGTEYLKREGFEEASCNPVYAESGPGRIRFNFEEELSSQEITDLAMAFNVYALSKLQGVDSIRLVKTTSEDIPEWTPSRSWRYFTITVKNADRSEIFKLKDDLEDDFAGISLEMKGFNMVYVFGLLSDNIEMFRNFAILLLIGLSIVINYQVLNHHIYKRRQNIGYLKTVGVDASLFKRIYLFESIVETLLFALLSLSITLLIGVFIPASSFLFRLDIFAGTFIGAMLLANVFVYLALITKYLRISFREMIDG